ncbi:MAG: class I SAM-dependent methyltransferase [Aeromicrobium sp.]
MTQWCRACLSTDVRDHPASRATGTVIQECCLCGLHSVRDRESLEFYAALYDGDRDSFEEWASELRTHVVDRRHVEALARLTGMLGPVESPSIFDIGAGDGAFLEMARQSGFRAHGNEVWTGAIQRARDVRDIELSFGDLSQLSDPGTHDVVTMWCVLAHVPDEDALLRRVWSMLDPGGYLLMQTPRYSSLDTMAMAMHDLTRGRVSRISDRRLAEHHMSLHTEKSIRQVLDRLGFEVVTVEARSRWGFTTESYLESLDLPQRVLRPAAKVIDRLVERGWFFRNVLDVLARRPAGP